MERAKSEAHVGDVVVGAPHKAIMQQKGGAMGQQRVTLHLSKSDAAFVPQAAIKTKGILSRDKAIDAHGETNGTVDCGLLLSGL